MTRAASAFGAAAARDKGCPRPRAVAVVVARRIAEDDDVEVDIVTEDIISLSLSLSRVCVKRATFMAVDVTSPRGALAG